MVMPGGTHQRHPACCNVEFVYKSARWAGLTIAPRIIGPEMSNSAARSDKTTVGATLNLI
jgi:hypothetical protein